ncbi:MAG: type III polyketide synthase [Actinobacteria bacterium]|nr:type III polyketide synthase [Actinomycetota bacterium]
MVVNAAIIGLGTAAPQPIDQDRLWEEFFADHFADAPAARAIFRRSGVRSRGGCVVPMKEDVREWATGARMRRFVEEAVPLGQEAVEHCLADAGLDAAEVDLFTVVSCTGYTTPGVDVLVAGATGMRADVERLHVGHMGCYAAIPALASVADAAAARGRTGVLLCVEVASVHVQAPTDDVGQVVAHALFADGAAAVAVAPRRQGLEVVDVAARTDAANGGHMGWDVTEHGFRMALSPDVPAILAGHVKSTVDELLGRHGLGIADVAAWAVHPGGPRILDVVGERLGLDEDQLGASREVLATAGNTSSATVLLILERVLATQPLAPGGPVVLMAFGPGLTLYTALLRLPQ